MSMDDPKPESLFEDEDFPEEIGKKAKAPQNTQPLS